MLPTEMLKQAGYEAGETVTGGNGVAPDKAKLKAGDVVRLKSGGPDMTVTEQDDSHTKGDWWCSYWDGTSFECRRFPADALKPTIASA